MDKVIVAVGDVHGCIDELDELLKKIEYKSDTMRLVFLGDLVHRGNDTLACVRRVRELGVECIKGNHEDKLLRWRKHEAKRKLSGKANPMREIADTEKFANESLSEDDLTWLGALPLKVDLGLNWWGVHAGCEPKYTLDKQSSSQIMRVRYVNQDGIAQALNPDKSQPEGTVYWDELWSGPESIIYGHCVHDLQRCRITHCQGDSDALCVGIDTGCCFGGHLTAAILHEKTLKFEGITPYMETYTPEFVQVKAKQKYFAGYGDE